jgi:4-amino-4-deoxy-L-arabinose transferase-like glycosyltransferase
MSRDLRSGVVDDAALRTLKTFLPGNSQEEHPTWLPALPRKWLLLTVAAAVALRLLFIFHWGVATPDSEVYAEIAKMWLRYGVYGLEGPDGAFPTLIRLPGYPAFLAAIFAVAGIDHYNAVRFVQAAVDVLTAFVISDLARRTVSLRAGAVAFVLWCLCPFAMNYAAAPLTETLAIFTTATALLFAVIGLESRSLKPWIGCGVAVGCGILLRPDGGILLISLGLFMLWRMVRTRDWRHMVAAGMVLGVVSLAPLVPWTIRNQRTFHRFEPLVPQSATDPGEYVANGFGMWMDTWAADYSALIDIGFKVDGEAIDADALPDRARGDAAEFARIQQLFAQYNSNLRMTPAVDAQFKQIAEARIRRSRFMFHVGLPVLRALDMWLRPRTEILPVDTHWWDFDQGWRDVTVSFAMGFLGLCYVASAIAGAFTRQVRYLSLFLLFCILRSAIIVHLQVPEPRYVLECFPVVMVLAGAAWDAWRTRRESQSAAS